MQCGADAPHAPEVHLRIPAGQAHDVGASQLVFRVTFQDALLRLSVIIRNLCTPLGSALKYSIVVLVDRGGRGRRLARPAARQMRCRT